MLGEQKFAYRKALGRRHHMLLLKRRLNLALQRVVELQRWVTSVEMVILLLMLLLCLKGGLGEYICHLILEGRVLMNGQRAKLLLVLVQTGLQ
jgi:hypothetical protein